MEERPERAVRIAVVVLANVLGRQVDGDKSPLPELVAQPFAACAAGIQAGAGPAEPEVAAGLVRRAHTGRESARRRLECERPVDVAYS